MTKLCGITDCAPTICTSGPASVPSSQIILYETFCERTYSLTCVGSLRSLYEVASPSTTSPRDLNSLSNFTSSGISRRHGPHHVAQMFTIITLSAKSASFKDSPSRVWSLVSRSSWGRLTNAGGGLFARSGAFAARLAGALLVVTFFDSHLDQP